MEKKELEAALGYEINEKEFEAANDAFCGCFISVKSFALDWNEHKKSVILKELANEFNILWSVKGNIERQRNALRVLLTSFLDEVDKMRFLENEYFKRRETRQLIDAKTQEKKVDDLIPHIKSMIKNGKL